MKRCERCGAKMMEYRHKLSKPLVRGLFKLLRVWRGMPVKLADLEGSNRLTHYQWSNFNKLRYFGLVEMGEKAGTWDVTELGLAFAFGEARVPPFVWTYRTVVVRFEGEPITFRDVTGLYWTREEWAADAMPHEDPPRPTR